MMDRSDPRYVEFSISSDEILARPDFKVWASPIATTAHSLASFGWRIYAIQRTPKHVLKTRPKIVFYPDGNRNFGFRFKPRAREPLKDQDEVIQEIVGLQGYKFSLTRFETKEVPFIPAHFVAELEKTKASVQEARSTIDVLEAKLQDAYHEIRLLRLNERRMMEEPDESELYTDQIRHLTYENELLWMELESLKDDPFRALSVWNDMKIAGMDFSEPLPEHPPVTPSNVIDIVEMLKNRPAPPREERLKKMMEN